MRAIVLESLGGPEALVLKEVPTPQPGPGQVLIRLHMAALNRRDAWIRKGQYAGIQLPAILGSDGVGEVVGVGPGVDDSIEGWRVVVQPGFLWGANPAHQGPEFHILGLPHPGTYAEYVVVPASHVHPAPSGLSDAEAAALPLAGLTAFRAVVTRGQAAVDEWVLVTGAGGGVASFAIQLARYQGAKVVVSSGSPAKIARAVELGAEGGELYTDPDWVKKLRERTEGGPHLIVDATGGAPFDQLVDLARPGGRIVSYGATLGSVPELQLRRLFWKQLTLMGSTLGTDAEFVELLKWVDHGALTPVVDGIYPMAQVAEAHARLEASEQFGKIVLDLQA